MISTGFRPLVSSFFFHSIFFPRLISAVADWMYTILLHMVWPWCEFKMQVWNVLHAARWKCRAQKSPKIRHLGTIACSTLSSCIFATKACIDNQKKNLLNINISPRALMIWWTSAH